MVMSKQKYRAVMREGHPAEKVVGAFGEMRENCGYYRGIKERDDSLQCTHKDATRGWGNWCAMDLCPLLRERAQAENLGWE